MIGHLVKRLREEQRLDAEYDRAIREAAIREKRLLVVDDSFDAFCGRQRRRLSYKLERAVTRVLAEYSDTDTFESRK